MPTGWRSVYLRTVVSLNVPTPLVRIALALWLVPAGDLERRSKDLGTHELRHLAVLSPQTLVGGRQCFCGKGSEEQSMLVDFARCRSNGRGGATPRLLVDWYWAGSTRGVSGTAPTSAATWRVMVRVVSEVAPLPRTPEKDAALFDRDGRGSGICRWMIP